MRTSISAILRQMSDKSEEITFIFDPGTLVFIYINDAIESITRSNKKGFTDNPSTLLDIVHPDDLKYVKESFDYLLKRKGSSLLNFRIIRSDGIERWIRAKIYPVMKNGKLQYLSGTAEDDTMRKASIFNMQKINGWKNSTLEILSHDLRSPIGTVQMLASLISSKVGGEEHDEVQKLTEMITKICKRNIDLVQAVLQKEILETAKVQLSKERLDMVWETRQIADVYIKAKEKLNRKVSLTSSHDKIFAEIDSMQFVQILNNLISNAIKFTADDGTIKIHIEQLEDSVLLTVADNGIGIPKSLQPILFTKYTKAGREGLDGQASVGLGMWIVKNLTDAHGGRVWFETANKKGTTFYVELPMGSYLLED